MNKEEFNKLSLIEQLSLVESGVVGTTMHHALTHFPHYAETQDNFWDTLAGITGLNDGKFKDTCYLVNYQKQLALNMAGVYCVKAFKILSEENHYSCFIELDTATIRKFLILMSDQTADQKFYEDLTKLIKTLIQFSQKQIN